MLNFPNLLDFGKEISNGIDNFFDWFRNFFSFLFNFIKAILEGSLNLIDDIFNDTPWWIWIIMIFIYVMFTYIIKDKKYKKLKTLSIITVFLVWIIIFNVLIKNPNINFNIKNTQTPWWIFIVLLFYISYKLHNYKTAITLSLLLVFIGVLGAWSAMLSTLSIIILSIIISFIIGLPLGILMAKSKRVEKVLKPILDMMQTIPTFVYLIPAVMLFSIGKVPATFATIIYAVPPLR